MPPIELLKLPVICIEFSVAAEREDGKPVSDACYMLHACYKTHVSKVVYDVGFSCGSLYE